ncbi:unnamed protein product [Rangifer tarandus platyrhynchus]|uniref:Uncharacterized protein n=1 Tax=Rangifer tarandus platyrhynchus TaxID=3082113 RepID=A0AC59ZS09_RANTA
MQRLQAAGRVPRSGPIVLPKVLRTASLGKVWQGPSVVPNPQVTPHAERHRGARLPHPQNPPFLRQLGRNSRPPLPFRGASEPGPRGAQPARFADLEPPDSPHEGCAGNKARDSRSELPRQRRACKSPSARRRRAPPGSRGLRAPRLWPALPRPQQPGTSSASSRSSPRALRPPPPAPPTSPRRRRRVPALPIGPRAVARIRSQSVAAVGAAPAQQAAEGEAIVDKLASERGSGPDCGGSGGGGFPGLWARGCPANPAPPLRQSWRRARLCSSHRPQEPPQPPSSFDFLPLSPHAPRDTHQMATDAHIRNNRQEIYPHPHRRGRAGIPLPAPTPSNRPPRAQYSQPASQHCKWIERRLGTPESLRGSGPTDRAGSTASGSSTACPRRSEEALLSLAVCGSCVWHRPQSARRRGRAPRHVPERGRTQQQPRTSA